MRLNLSPFAIFFNGRIDKTLKKINKATSLQKTWSAKSSVACARAWIILCWPCITQDRITKHISEEILELLTSDSNSSYLRAIGCDGTNVNTGTINGVIVGLEKTLKSSLQWIGCQLHANELPLRHLMQKLDGKTNGPAGFTGKIGKALKDCEKLLVNVHFNPIPAELITVDCDDFSTD